MRAGRGCSGTAIKTPSGQEQRSAPYDDEDLQPLFTLDPEDLGFVCTARSERNRLALVLLLVWACVGRKLVSDPLAFRPRSLLSSPVSSG